MYHVYWQQQGKIEIALKGEINNDEIAQIIHQLESLAAMYQDIELLLDGRDLKKYNIGVMLDEFEFYQKYRRHLKRVAVVSDRKFQSFLLEFLSKFSDTEFKAFSSDQIESARKWIFPSRLP